MPLLSIIIPVYNVQNYLDECLISILNQEFKDYEIILINNASKDNSGAICDSYALKHPQIKVIHLEVNALPGGARNVGLQHAVGEYIHFCDSDDYYLTGSLSKVADTLISFSPSVLIGQFICNPEKGAFLLMMCLSRRKYLIRVTQTKSYSIYLAFLIYSQHRGELF